jgi:hypothetical protein
MNTYRKTLTRRAAERILDHRGDPTEPLAQVVDAAAAPSPVAGEDQATALFRAATGLVPVPTSGGASTMNRLVRRIAALPAVGVAAGALALGGGGLALAATHGAVNVPFTGHDNRADHAPAAPTSANPGLTRTPGAPQSPGTARPTSVPSATPSPSLVGLCHAYQAGAVPRKTSNPAFAALAAAAGGAGQVTGYCSGVLGAASHPTPSHPTPSHPTSPAHPAPSATPTHPVPDHATTPPGPRPTQAASPTIPPRPTRAAHE